MPLVSFLTHGKYEKTSGFRMFSGGSEKDWYHEMVDISSIFVVVVALSKVSQLSWHNTRRKEERTKSLLISDEDRSPTNLVEKPETSSLTDLRQDLLNPNDIQKPVMSSSMGDITETDGERNEKFFYLFIFLLLLEG